MNNPEIPQIPRIPVDFRTEPAPVYANGAHVVHTLREFAVLFDDRVPFPGRNGDNGAESLGRIVASLRMTPDAYFQMVAALASSWNSYVQRFIDPRLPQPPKFKLDSAEGYDLDAFSMAPGAGQAPPQQPSEQG